MLENHPTRPPNFGEGRVGWWGWVVFANLLPVEPHLKLDRAIKQNLSGGRVMICEPLVAG